LAESLTRGSLFAKGSKVSVLALAGRLGITQGGTIAAARAIEVQFFAGISLALVAPPGSLADAFFVLIGDGEVSPKVAGRARSMLAAIGLTTEVSFAVGSNKSGLALAGLGTAVAVRVSIVASPGAISGTVRGIDDAS